MGLWPRWFCSVIYPIKILKIVLLIFPAAAMVNIRFCFGIRVFWPFFHGGIKLRLGFRSSLTACKARTANHSAGVSQSFTRLLAAFRPRMRRGLPLKPGGHSLEYLDSKPYRQGHYRAKTKMWPQPPSHEPGYGFYSFKITLDAMLSWGN